MARVLTFEKHHKRPSDGKIDRDLVVRIANKLQVVAVNYPVALILIEQFLDHLASQ